MKTIEIVKDILSAKTDVSGITENTCLVDLNLDSLDLVEISLEMEDRFNIDFTSEEISKMITLGDVIKLIEQKTK